MPEADIQVTMLPEPDVFPRTVLKSYTLTHTIAKEAILIHSDVWLLKDVQPWFEDTTFDVALPLREDKELMAAFPEVIYQSGAVMLSRSEQFWFDIYNRFASMIEWRGGKFDVALHNWLFKSGYRVLGMAGLLHTPDPWNDDWKTTPAYALHYEARRRKQAFMKNHGGA